MATKIPRSWTATAPNPLLPFLYQTRTLRAPSHKLTQCRSASGTTWETYDEAEPAGSRPPSTRTNKQLRYQSRSRKNFLQRQAALRAGKADSPPQPSKHLPTMTHGEKMVFSDLLSQLEPLKKHQESRTETETQKQKPAKKQDDRSEMAKLSAIFDNVLKDIRKKDQRLKGAEVHSKGKETSAEADEQRKLELRSKLEKFQKGELDISQLNDDPDVPMKSIIATIVQRESMQIEGALRRAVTEGKEDIEAWDICKRRIFSLLQHLEKPGVKPELKTQPDKSTSEPETTGPLNLPPSIPVEPVVALLYPKVLLLAFRHLNTHYPNSPLIGQFRPSIKSHSRISAVIGASTELYNELIYFYWRGCDDIPGVVSLLQEMQNTGLEPDYRTCELLRVIRRERDRDISHREETGSSPWGNAPNRKALRRLFDSEGWLERMERRVAELEDRRRRGWGYGIIR